MARGVQQRENGGGEEKREDIEGGGRRRPLGKTGGADTDCVLRGGDDGGGYVADCGVNPEREKVVQRNWVGGGDVEGRGDNLTLPAHDRNHLPQRPTRFPGGLRYWDSHPRGQAASAACIHEGGSPVCESL